MVNASALYYRIRFNLLCRLVFFNNARQISSFLQMSGLMMVVCWYCSMFDIYLDCFQMFYCHISSYIDLCSTKILGGFHRERVDFLWIFFNMQSKVLLLFYTILAVFFSLRIYWIEIYFAQVTWYHCFVSTHFNEDLTVNKLQVRWLSSYHWCHWYV